MEKNRQDVPACFFLQCCGTMWHIFLHRCGIVLQNAAHFFAPLWYCFAKYMLNFAKTIDLQYIPNISLRVI
jgi:hypothetical protein